MAAFWLYCRAVETGLDTAGATIQTSPRRPDETHHTTYITIHVDPDAPPGMATMDIRQHTWWIDENTNSFVYEMSDCYGETVGNIRRIPLSTIALTEVMRRIVDEISPYLRQRII
jgi:hypothetical protein